MDDNKRSTNNRIGGVIIGLLIVTMVKLFIQILGINIIMMKKEYYQS